MISNKNKITSVGINSRAIDPLNTRILPKPAKPPSQEEILLLIYRNNAYLDAERRNRVTTQSSPTPGASD